MTVRSSADLRELLDAIDVCYFDGLLDEIGVEIKWMRRNRGSDPTKHAQYWLDERTIEVGRHLAVESVPRVFVMQVIHHEACHAVYGPAHSRPFQLAERQFLHFYEAAEWERSVRNKPWQDPPTGLR